jgi:hypothetical protein
MDSLLPANALGSFSTTCVFLQVTIIQHSYPEKVIYLKASYTCSHVTYTLPALAMLRL